MQVSENIWIGDALKLGAKFCAQRGIDFIYYLSQGDAELPGACAVFHVVGEMHLMPEEYDEVLNRCKIVSEHINNKIREGRTVLLSSTDGKQVAPLVAAYYFLQVLNQDYDGVIKKFGESMGNKTYENMLGYLRGKKNTNIWENLSSNRNWGDYD